MNLLPANLIAQAHAPIPGAPPGSSNGDSTGLTFEAAVGLLTNSILPETAQHAISFPFPTTPLCFSGHGQEGNVPFQNGTNPGCHNANPKSQSANGNPQINAPLGALNPSFHQASAPAFASVPANAASPQVISENHAASQMPQPQSASGGNPVLNPASQTLAGFHPPANQAQPSDNSGLATPGTHDFLGTANQIPGSSAPAQQSGPANPAAVHPQVPIQSGSVAGQQANAPVPTQANAPFAIAASPSAPTISAKISTLPAAAPIPGAALTISATDASPISQNPVSANPTAAHHGAGPANNENSIMAQPAEAHPTSTSLPAAHPATAHSSVQIISGKTDLVPAAHANSDASASHQGVSSAGVNASVPPQTAPPQTAPVPTIPQTPSPVLNPVPHPSPSANPGSVRITVPVQQGQSSSSTPLVPSGLQNPASVLKPGLNRPDTGLTGVIPSPTRAEQNGSSPAQPANPAERSERAVVVESLIPGTRPNAQPASISSTSNPVVTTAVPAQIQTGLAAPAQTPALTLPPKTPENASASPASSAPQAPLQNGTAPATAEPGRSLTVGNDVSELMTRNGGKTVEQKENSSAQSQTRSAQPPVLSEAHSRGAAPAPAQVLGPIPAAVVLAQGREGLHQGLIGAIVQPIHSAPVARAPQSGENKTPSQIVANPGNSGTRAAQQFNPMAFNGISNNELDLAGKILPSAGRNGGLFEGARSNLPGTDAEGSRLSRISELAHGSGLGNQLPHRISDLGEPIESRSFTRLRLSDEMWSAVEQFRALNSQDWAVRIRPDQQTQIQLYMKLQNNQLVIQARMERGNPDAMTTHWSELQSLLGERGITLKPLDTSAHSQSMANSNLFLGQEQKQSASQQQSRMNPELAMSMNLGPEESLEQTSGKGAALKGDTWESWA